MSDKNDGMIYWLDPADETTKVQTRGSNGCEWCVINLGRGDCTYINDLANCPFTDEDIVLLNNVFMALQQRRLNPASITALQAVAEDQTGELTLIAVDNKIAKACAEALYKLALPDTEGDVVIVAVPKELDSLVGWKTEPCGPVKFDRVKETLECDTRRITETSMVWFWTKDGRERGE